MDSHREKSWGTRIIAVRGYLSSSQMHSHPAVPLLGIFPVDILACVHNVFINRKAVK